MVIYIIILFINKQAYCRVDIVVWNSKLFKAKPSNLATFSRQVLEEIV